MPGLPDDAPQPATPAITLRFHDSDSDEDSDDEELLTLHHRQRQEDESSYEGVELPEYWQRFGETSEAYVAEPVLRDDAW